MRTALEKKRNAVTTPQSNTKTAPAGGGFSDDKGLSVCGKAVCAEISSFEQQVIRCIDNAVVVDIRGVEAEMIIAERAEYIALEHKAVGRIHLAVVVCIADKLIRRGDEPFDLHGEDFIVLIKQ